MRDMDKATEQRVKAQQVKAQQVKEEPKAHQALRKKKRKRSSAAVCGTAVRDF
jgi:hypothetical protein